MIRSKTVSRRGALKLAAAATALPLVHIRTTGAAGKVSIGFWDHWVPGGNDVMQKQVNAWAEKNKVEVQADFITGNGNKLSMTAAAEAQAKAGHDAMTFYNWDVHNHADSLEPIDDVMTRLIAANGDVNKTCSYLAHKKKGCGGANQQRHADQAALRTDQLVPEAGARCAGNVSGPSGRDAAAE